MSSGFRPCARCNERPLRDIGPIVHRDGRLDADPTSVAREDAERGMRMRKQVLSANAVLRTQAPEFPIHQAAVDAHDVGDAVRA